MLDWAASASVELRDAVVIVPFAALLPAARAAFAAQGGWMPRIETTLTLANSLGPARTAAPQQLSFDRTLDRLSVAQWLRSTGWGQQWGRSDKRAFDLAVSSVVDTAHMFARTAAQVAPSERDALWQRWRSQLTPSGGPGAKQRALAQFAMEWASQAPAPNTDRLFALQPSAWVIVQAGGEDPLMRALAEASETPALRIDLDPSPDHRFDPPGDPPTFAICDDFEHEAQCSAAQVLEHVRNGETPIALISQDRVLVRRVRALLERQGLALHDETGWTLSTTRAAAQVMSLLKAARPVASTDMVLDWLKSGTRWSTGADAALSRFEADCRRQQRVRAAELKAETFDEPARTMWTEASAVLAELHASNRRPLAAWLVSTVRALQATGVWESLKADDAGAQVLAHLHLNRAEDSSAEEGLSASAAWAARLGTASMSYAEYVDWIDGVLEQATFIPSAGPQRKADVVVTPLGRSMLRPFAAVVCPGADARRLGASGAPHPLLSDMQLAELGLPSAAQRRADEADAFAQLLRLPRLTFLRRRVDGNEPLADSPLIERLSLALLRRGKELTSWRDPRPTRTIDRVPVGPSAAVAPSLLPARLSASACEALRACPYRFFTLHMLHAREADELDEELAKRDYGNWLHAVLHAFHLERGAAPSRQDDEDSLRKHAESQRAMLGLDAADFEPFAASFEAFVPRYVAWQHERDVQGIRWHEGEQRHTMRLAGVEAIELEGVIDRVDEGPGARLQLIDYKTGSVSDLKAKAREPLEDTQLAFYAALTRSRSTLPLTATYLALDGREIEEIEHREVEASALALLEGLGSELRRVQAGEGMLPLGEAEACTYCAARGVCRRDHWSVPPDSVGRAE